MTKGQGFVNGLCDGGQRGVAVTAEAECDGFLTSPVARAERVARAHTDFEFFCRTYFPHYVRSEASLFHRWLYDVFPKLIDKPGGQLMNVSAPRGEAKSTLGTQLGTLWLIANLLVGSDAPLTIAMFDRMKQGATPVLNAVSLFLMLGSGLLGVISVLVQRDRSGAR